VAKYLNMTDQHPLAAWIAQHTNQAKFAADARCSASHLSLVLQGKRGVSLKLAKRLSEATDGAVRVEDFVNPEVAQ
jgi:hypothetical protein